VYTNNIQLQLIYHFYSNVKSGSNNLDANDFNGPKNRHYLI